MAPGETQSASQIRREAGSLDRRLCDQTKPAGCDLRMTRQEKYLYHQIHPLKLITDAGAGFGSLYPLWHHHLGLALAIMLVPPPLVSFLLMTFANLERYRQSALGKYIARSMSHTMEAIRLLGMIVVAFGAWRRSPWMILAGCAVILFAWLRGTLSAKIEWS